MSPVATAAGRRMPVRTIPLSFEWEGITWSATMRIDAPSRVVDDFFADDTAKMKGAIQELVTAWDFVDEAGEPLPLPRDGGIAGVPYRLLNALVAEYMREMLAAANPPKDSETSTEPG